jgi:hypothetical protein
MPQDANCPKCKHVFPVTEARHPFTVACPRCEGDLTVEFKKPATPPEPGEPHYELLVKPGALPGTSGPPPVPKRKSDDDDTRGGGSMMVVLLSGGLGLLFVLLGLGVTGWYLFTQVDTSSGYVNRNNFSNNNRPGNNFNPTPVPNPGGGGVRPNPNPNPNPGGIRPNPNPDPFPPAPNPFPPNPFPPEPAKPKDTFELRPVNGTPDRITPPTTLAANESHAILLPGRAEHVAVGGGGRYIVFQFPQQRRLAVFDASAGDLLPDTGDLEGNGGLMAAGANKLVVPSNQRNKYRVLSLPGLQRESEFELPIFHGARGLAMGSRTNGPLLAIDPFGETVLMDLTTGKAVEGSRVRNECPKHQLRATADGKLFLVGDSYNDRDKFKLLDEQGQKWRLRDPDVAAAYISADGKKLYAKNQVLTVTGNQLAGTPTGATESVWYVPAVTSTGDYFLSVYLKKGQFPRTKDAVVVTLLKGTNVSAPVLTAWTGLPETADLVSVFGNSTEVLDKHLFLIPEAKLLVILNKDRTRLVVRKLLI